MSTNAINPEQISAFVDGELDDAEIEVLLKALYNTESHSKWDMYHQIGDVLRSDELAISLNSGFAERMATKLVSEPTILALSSTISQPSIARNGKENVSATTLSTLRIKPRWAFSGIAAVAIAASTFVSAPQLMVAWNNNEGVVHNQLFSRATKQEVLRDQENVALSNNPSSKISKANGEVVLRDPRIDDYLLAHQSFSPSVYSTAQYARSATFATDSSK